MPTFTHLNEKNEVHMVDVTPKPDVPREATASGRIYLRPETLKAIAEGTVVKGNVLATAQVAGTMAVKQTWALIPMCHPIPVGAVTVSFVQTGEYIEISCRVKTFGKTGIEMEALTGASVALLTIWDMVKSAEKDENGQYPVTRIEGVHVVEKIKGDAE
ncbi:cyclic pyranopterin monophosphate synthase MoaC [Methanocorpusculum vombati]|uniref:Probable cyclic pyranopterin monophosphate synthase n=1 Tax=Methanocorpusculum vombati TaxID=3002864 RepID=A0ABT4ILW2_9EURY|nr:cyclic pyranopterin monophosphate synthase MoaC [Methanocorpusculum vombati]MCZ9319889.1 cyclic pyranopterin monophosphate synthase MoaC [Methanocorpusculum sp.]MCZ0862754.1 cyclic pyranopterin monophosphate synthase MoaC [Methanocorpusculum vombati]MDE2520637.1 cyclic pyranopterin monophosphate synthase MoaC [Methanocorpusculum sp.]MDE2534174.1 cyclic pyranopterin monophosphate synthase MoaC [Methanocorpusculum sp.]MDE2545402.1 cyclic pyranopterin monophosphate synthase MoaC [Methanocorpus